MFFSTWLLATLGVSCGGEWLAGTSGVSSGVRPAAALGLNAALGRDGWGGFGGKRVAPSHRLEEVPCAQGCPGLPHPSVQRLVEGWWLRPNPGAGWARAVWDLPKEATWPQGVRAELSSQCRAWGIWGAFLGLQPQPLWLSTPQLHVNIPSFLIPAWAPARV